MKVMSKIHFITENQIKSIKDQQIKTTGNNVYLFEHKWSFIVYWVYAIVWYYVGFKSLSVGISW